MASSCPYCGAALKLKFCVVCGRQSKLNKMGNLRNTVRNTDATTRLEDPFLADDNQPTKALRFKTSKGPKLLATLGILVAGILIFCAAKVAFDLYAAGEVNRILMPWMQTHHIKFPNGWPKDLSILTQYRAAENPKSTKGKHHAGQHGRSATRKVK